MVRDKATITVDREKVAKARALTGGRSVSAVIDVALDRLIRAEQLRRDVAAYARWPVTDAELAIGDLPVRLDLADDEIDYEALYGMLE
ncbi:MAG: type II toxin-antitoxin system VapB family antitoxin [Chloroflexota bacterium]